MVDQVDLVRRAKVIILNEGGNHAHARCTDR